MVPPKTTMDLVDLYPPSLVLLILLLYASRKLLGRLGVRLGFPNRRIPLEFLSLAMLVNRNLLRANIVRFYNRVDSRQIRSIPHLLALVRKHDWHITVVSEFQRTAVHHFIPGLEYGNLYICVPEASLGNISGGDYKNSFRGAWGDATGYAHEAVRYAGCGY